MGENDRLDLVEAAPDVVEVGQNQVDAGLVVLREEHAAVDHQQAARMLEDGHVAADLAEPTQWDDSQAALGQRRRVGQLRVGMAHSRPASMRSARSSATCASVASTSGERIARLLSTPV